MKLLQVESDRGLELTQRRIPRVMLRLLNGPGDMLLAKVTESES